MNTKMSFETFQELLVEKIREKMGEEYTIDIKKVKKNNGIEKNGLIAQRENNNTSPAIYIDDFFKEDLNEDGLDKIADFIYKEYQKAEFEESLDLSNFIEPDKAKNEIVFKLINYERNGELLKNVPHRQYLNLAIVYYYVVKEAPFNGNASILISNQHMNGWNSCEEDLFALALRNTPRILPWKLDNMENLLEELLPDGKPDQEPMFPMYVLSNEAKVLGAACMLYPNVMEACALKFNGNFYLLPSSIHESILIPENENCQAEVLLGIVTEINETQVAPEEVLADAVYYYDQDDRELRQTC